MKLEVEPKLVELRADPERLRQVFINLVDNALKFTPKDGTITVRARNVEVSGAGVPGGDDDDDGFALLAPAQTKLEVRVMDARRVHFRPVTPSADQLEMFEEIRDVDEVGRGGGGRRHHDEPLRKRLGGGLRARARGKRRPGVDTRGRRGSPLRRSGIRPRRRRRVQLLVLRHPEADRIVLLRAANH